MIKISMKGMEVGMSIFLRHFIDDGDDYPDAEVIGDIVKIENGDAQYRCCASSREDGWSVGDKYMLRTYSWREIYCIENDEEKERLKVMMEM